MVFAGLGCTHTCRMPREQYRSRLPSGHPMPELIAHRGASRQRRENTLPAFQLALELGADAIELDVHATADGVVVVHHDPEVVAGERRIPIAGTVWAPLREVPLPGGERMPTLMDVLALVGDRATIYVEIKGAGIEASVASILKNSRSRCAVHSFDHRAAQRHHELAPEIPVGVLSASYPIDPIAPVRAAGAQALWQEWHLIDADLVARAHEAGVRVIAWTVNDAAEARRLVKLGVDALCGDDVAMLREFIGYHGVAPAE